MMKKKGISFGFEWLFAIVVGVVVLVLAIFAVSRFVSTEREIIDTKTGKQIGILLNPLGTSIESGKVSKINLQSETHIFNRCKDIGQFGAQEISVASKSDIGREWENEGVSSTFYDKYIFSNSTISGKSFIVFSKPFEFPFKIGELIFAWSESTRYCFVEPPVKIKEEIEGLDINSVNLTNNLKECEKNSIKVCFRSSGCDIDVDINLKNVEKNGESVYYEGELVYGAIFAEPKIYECHVKRLMRRGAEIALLYTAKSEYLSSKGCSSNLEFPLVDYADKARNITSSQELINIKNIAEDIENKNDALVCKLF